MRNLNYELKQLWRRNRDGSYATQRDRERVLDLAANQLQELGYRHMAAASLKPKHVERLVERWQAEGLAVGTIKNRMSELRWWAEKIDVLNAVTVEDPGISYVSNLERLYRGSKLTCTIRAILNTVMIGTLVHTDVDHRDRYIYDVVEFQTPWTRPDTAGERSAVA